METEILGENFIYKLSFSYFILSMNGDEKSFFLLFTTCVLLLFIHLNFKFAT